MATKLRIELSAKCAVTVNGDANRLELLVRNLLDNAVKFSRPGASPVQVAIRSAAAAVLFIRPRDEGGTEVLVRF